MPTNTRTHKPTAADYMMEPIDYGGVTVPRGYAYQKLLDVAIAQGHSKRESRILADRWMQGYDLRRKIHRETNAHA